ncbi:MAG: hypothetical protein MJ097_08600, partial [Dorea sp.]|nr:hypothetical protein [Dorea sp.]
DQENEGGWNYLSDSAGTSQYGNLRKIDGLGKLGLYFFKNNFHAINQFLDIDFGCCYNAFRNKQAKARTDFGLRLFCVTGNNTGNYPSFSKGQSRAHLRKEERQKT